MGTATRRPEGSGRVALVRVWIGLHVVLLQNHLDLAYQISEISLKEGTMYLGILSNVAWYNAPMSDRGHPLRSAQRSELLKLWCILRRNFLSV